MILKELFVKLGLDVDAQSFLKGNLAAKAVEKGLEKIVELGHELKERFMETLEAGDKIKKMSQKIGIATDALQELQYAGSLADVSAEDMAQSIGFLSKNMEAAKEGGEEAKKSFKGLEFKNANGQLKTADEMLATIAEKFSDMPDGVEKTAQAMKLFGKSGKQMIPLLNEGAAGLEEMKKEAHELGLVLDTEAIEASEKLNDNFTRLKAVTTGIWRQAIAPLIPAINRLVEKFLKWKKENAALISQQMQKYLGYVLDGIEAVGGAFSFLVRNINSLKTILMPFLYALAPLIAMAFAPLAGVTALITTAVAILDDLDRYQKGKKSLFGSLKKKLDEWGDSKGPKPWWLSVMELFVDAIKDAIKLKKEFDDLINPKADTKQAEIAKVVPGEKQKGLSRIGQELRRAVTPGLETGLNVTDYMLNDPNSYGGKLKTGLARGELEAKPNWWGGTNYEPVTDPARQRELAAQYASQHVNINVNMHPGQSAQDVAEAVDRQLKASWEEAHAGGH